MAAEQQQPGQQLVTVRYFRGIHRERAPHLREEGELDEALNLWAQNGALRIRHGLVALGTSLTLIEPSAIPSFTNDADLPDWTVDETAPETTEKKVPAPPNRPVRTVWPFLT